MGALAVRRGDCRETERISEESARLDRPFLFGTPLGDKKRIMTQLRDTFAKGCEFSSCINRDMDLESLRGYAPFKELMKPKG
jgi:hypothetical protein